MDISRILKPGWQPARLVLLASGLLLAACTASPESAAARDPATPPGLAQAADSLPLPTLVPSVSPTTPPTNTPPPTATPSATLTPVDTPTPTLSPTPTATPVTLNDIPLDDVIVLTGGARQHIRQIADRGRALGRNPHAFARIGGSVAATQHFMGRFDSGPYDLGPYDDLQATIDYYKGSFSRVGQGAMRGLTAKATFNPTWSDPDFCQPNETVIDCEIRLHNPSVIIIVLGTNDIGTGEKFETDMRALLAHIIELGIVPILATKSDRYEGPDDRNNTIIRELAADLQIPLWDFDLIAGTIPGRGMGSDNVHLTLYDQYDYTSDRALQRGYGVYNLTALMMLDAVRQELAP